MDMCFYCRHFWEDISVGATDCKKAELLSEEEFERYFISGRKGCPFFEEMEAKI